MTSQVQLLSVFQEFCKAEKWYFYPIGSASFVTYVNGQTSKWETMCTIKETQIAIVSELPFVVPPENHLTVLEFLMWANCQQPLGNFELDLQQRDIRFKTSIEVADGVLTTKMLAALLYSNLHTVNLYIMGLQQILFAGKTLAEAARFLCEPARTEEEDAQSLREMFDDPDLANLLGDAHDQKEKGVGD
jgi:hypothetical protein